MQALIICLLSFFSVSQSAEIITNCDFFEIDHLGNIYVINDFELLKYDSEGNKICNFSDVSLGNISSVDTSDPLRILLFYKDFNQVIYLNNKLSKIGNEIDLYDFSDNETELVCNSQKGGFWIFNTVENQAFHISNNGRLTDESILLGSFFGESSILKITENNSHIFLLYDNKGILQLDQNGQFVRQLTIRGIWDFQFQGNSVYYENESGFYEYSPLDQKDHLIYSKRKNQKKTIRYKDDKIFISNGKSISIKKLSF